MVLDSPVSMVVPSNICIHALRFEKREQFWVFGSITPHPHPSGVEGRVHLMEELEGVVSHAGRTISFQLVAQFVDC